ncbi:hypothetical protein V8C35DRAFT_36842 [Trichoderma chlorosporum]
MISLCVFNLLAPGIMIAQTIAKVKRRRNACASFFRNGVPKGIGTDSLVRSDSTASEYMESHQLQCRRYHQEQL